MANNINENFNTIFSNWLDLYQDVSLVTKPEALPGWFFNPPIGDNNTFFVIGISDPWLDEFTGNAQAKSRARFLASFMKRTSAKGITDLYKEGSQYNKFEQISNFNCTFKLVTAGIVVDSFVTKYNEYLYLCKFTFAKTTKETGSRIAYYKQIINQDIAYSRIEKFELFGEKDFRMEYLYFVNNNDFEITSIFNSDTISIKPTIYQYVNNKNTINLDSVAKISFFRRGLWNGYFKSLIENIDLAASKIKSQQKSVFETNALSRRSENIEQLNREIYNTSFSFQPTSINFLDDEMVISIKVYNE